MMRASLLTTAGVTLLCASAVVAQAADRTKVGTATYPISGVTGAELYASMQRHGPRHGFLSRAIAQTSYKVEWHAEVEADGDVCRVVEAYPMLDMTYTFPEPAENLSPAVRKRWRAFMAGVKRHEERHGALARQMVRAAEAAVKGLTIRGDRSCSKTRWEVRRRANAVYATYEARQRAFDAKEHRDRGNIDRLIRALIRQ